MRLSWLQETGSRRLTLIERSRGMGFSQTGPAFTQAPLWHFTSLSGSLYSCCHHETLLAFPQGIFMGLSLPQFPGSRAGPVLYPALQAILTLSLARGYSKRCLAPLFVLFFTGGLCMPGPWPHLSQGSHRQGEERRPQAGASLFRSTSPALALFAFCPGPLRSLMCSEN